MPRLMPPQPTRLDWVLFRFADTSYYLGLFSVLVLVLNLLSLPFFFPRAVMLLPVSIVATAVAYTLNIISNLWLRNRGQI